MYTVSDVRANSVKRIASAVGEGSVLLICEFFPSGEEFQAASGISSRTVERKAVSKAPTALRPVSVSW